MANWYTFTSPDKFTSEDLALICSPLEKRVAQGDYVKVRRMISMLAQIPGHELNRAARLDWYTSQQDDGSYLLWLPKANLGWLKRLKTFEEYRQVFLHDPTREELDYIKSKAGPACHDRGPRPITALRKSPNKQAKAKKLMHGWYFEAAPGQIDPDRPFLITPQGAIDPQTGLPPTLDP